VADRGTEDVLSGTGTAEPAAPTPPPEPAVSAPVSAEPKVAVTLRVLRWIGRYFSDQDPTFWVAFTPSLLVSALLFVRSPASNYIFDEQEALLANPYVNGGKIHFFQVFQRDFWGLPPDRTIGSYRPLPDMVWRLLWHVSKLPWLHHWVNVVLHGVNGALIASIAFSLTRRRDLAWLAGGAFVASAVLTEAITGVVGIADVMGGLGVLLALAALRLPLGVMPFAVFGAVSFGMFSKESALVALPLLAWAALCWAPLQHPERPLRVLRALLALCAATGALALYTYVRRKYFPISLPAELAQPLPATDPSVKRAMHAFLRWFQQPRLPRDPINNPLADADFPHRVAGALRVYFRGLTQVVFPWRLSGDYSFPQEPAPARLVFPESVLGALGLVVMPLVGVGSWVAGMVKERRARRAGRERPAADAWPWLLVAVGLVWIPVSYFPHSNIPVLLPTVRAERFWYLPVIGTALVLGTLFARALAAKRFRSAAVLAITVFFGFQAAKARLHALDYSNDLLFWRATRAAVPRSAKAQLNYSVMVGAHLNDLPKRLAINAEAIRLAPKWPMAHIYYGDTLCRMHKPDEAWPEYVKGFELNTNDPNLIALALQCLWDEKAIDRHEAQLLDFVESYPGSWLAYFSSEIVYHGKENGGIEKKYRPRGYDEGPKKD
jgi:hypothetical protein